jgi:hypothetical protein
MKLSTSQATTATKENLLSVIRKLEALRGTIETDEELRLLRHLRDGYPAVVRTKLDEVTAEVVEDPAYELSNSLVKALGNRYPDLVVE